MDNERSSLENFINYSGSGAQGAPVTGVDYYNYTRGLWKDGSQMVWGGNGHFSSGGTVPASFMHPGTSDPLGWSTPSSGGNPTNDWSEITEVHSPGDRRGIGSMGGFTLEPEAIHRIDVALVSAIDYTASGNNQSPVAIMNERIDSVRSYFCSGLISNCASGGFSTSIESEINDEISMNITPNPFLNSINVAYKPDNKSAKLLIYNLIGEQIMNHNLAGNTTLIDLSKQPSGIYFVTVIDGNKKLNKKIIKQ